ncbi:MAG: hypothetical protein Q9217_005827 [Psora testacea]
MAGDEEDLKEFDDPPPKLVRNIAFWLWHIFCWTYYGLVTLVYIPWALAMHAVLIAAAIPLSLLCFWRGGRKVFLYFYCIFVLLPGKFLWFNLYRRNRQRGRVYDFEMDKPRAIPLQNRRRLSVSEQATAQPTSQLLNKLPPEIRHHIYRHAFIGDSAWFDVIDSEVYPDKLKKGKRVFKNRAYPCVLTESDTEEDSLDYNLSILHRTPRICRDDNHLAAGLALLQTCRQIYMEAIGLFYSLPTFNFTTLHHPPFFLRRALPHRLACIRSIHLVYDQNNLIKPTSQSHVGCNTARYWHRVGECTFCNPIHWLDGIKKYMTGLKSVEMYIYLERKQQMSLMGDAWVARLFDLQVGPNGLRQMKIHVSPKKGMFQYELTGEEAFSKKVQRLDEMLQQRLKENIKKYASGQRTSNFIPVGCPPPVLIPPPMAHAKGASGMEALTLDLP